MLGLGLEERVCDAQIVICAEPKQPLSVVVHSAHAKWSKTGGPGVVVSTHSGIEVSKENELFRVGDDLDSCCEIQVS